MRQKLGITQTELAKLAGVSQSIITKIERGKIEPSYSIASKIFMVLEEQLAKEIKKDDPVKDMIESTVNLLQKGKLDEAEELVARLERLAPSNPKTQELKEATQEKRFETTAKEMIRLDSIAELAMSVDKITQMALSPEEGFIVSRINGIWDVQSIIKIAPFGETDSFKIFKKFLDEGIIRFAK